MSEWKGGAFVSIQEITRPVESNLNGVYILYLRNPIIPIYVGKGKIKNRLHRHAIMDTDDPPKLREAFSNDGRNPISYRYISLSDEESSNLENKLYNEHKNTLYNRDEPEGDGTSAPDVGSPFD